ncbi:MAG: gamma-glutamyltransferase family protein [Gammaproteobacteria bacterium]|nr:gamma-glutamyltransferase family protein [Gammaproteobacteria bacterium]
MVTAPHHAAAQAGLAVLREGGNALEAMIAAAATIAVVYPHMNGLGGDNFWLVHAPGAAPLAIASCGAAAREASFERYLAAGLDAIPSRGPMAALTVAGAVAGWDEALRAAAEWGGRLPRARLLEDAVRHAREGIAVSVSQADNTQVKLAELRDVPGFAAHWLIDDEPPAAGARFRQPRLADTLEHLGRAGFDDFYRGELAVALADDLGRVGSPLRAADLAAHHARRVTPLSVKFDGHTLYNHPPPTQGLASLLLLALYARRRAADCAGFDYLHRLVEATKQAFLVRDAEVTDPGRLRGDVARFLEDGMLERLAARIDTERALPWPAPPTHGDTVWLGAADGDGRMVSFIQSVYWEFGSGVTLPASGVTWQNRGTSFSLDPNALNALAPGRLPFHTIQPALAELADGRVLVYGTMGGEGQPQTQAAIFSRHVMHGMDLQAAVDAPRWLLGRTWGARSTTLKLEDDFPVALGEALVAAGHALEWVPAANAMMGHAGAISRAPDGLLEGASDRRSDGAVAAW